MLDKKNIDRLFQEKLQDFEQEPRPEVWSQIQGRMQQKKKRRFAAWWLYAGAAILIFGVFILIPDSPSPDDIVIDPIITSSPKKEVKTLDPTKDAKKEDSFENTDPINESPILVTEKSKEDDIQPNKVNKTIQQNNIPKEAIAQNIPTENTDPKDDYSSVIKKEEKGGNTANIVVKKESDPKKTTDTKLPFVEKEDATKTKPITQKKKKLLTQLDEEILEDPENNKKWSVRPLVAFSTLANSSSSPSGQGFQNNATSGNASLNYGLSVGYAINDKLILQTGVMTQNVSFNTEDVVVISQPNVSSASSSISIREGVSYIVSGSSSLVTVGNTSAAINITDRNAELNQVIRYIEIPVEAKYRVTNSKKLRSYIIGGFSSLFLQNDEVTLISNVVGRSDIGTASNLNSVNFSGNLGLDLDYQIAQNLFLNINPMIKVHLNTFSRNSNGYQPYFMGVYSGIKYQF